MFTHTKSSKKQPHSLHTIAERSAVPLFLFGFVLVSLLMLSWFYLLPEFTRIEVGGLIRDASSLRTYHASLTEQISEVQEQRDALVLPMEGTSFRALTEKKHNQLSIFTLRADLENIAQRVELEEGTRVVFIRTFSYSPLKKTLTFSGDVRNVGPRSMTVLAQFVEEVQKLDGIAEIDTPRFTREQAEDGTFFSPFSFHITLQ